MNNCVFHGLEIEIQFMTEINDTLHVVDAGIFFNYQLQGLNSNISFDMGNIEIRTSPSNSYKDSISEANKILRNRLIPCLVNYFEKNKLKKFALFLPVPMSRLYGAITSNNDVEYIPVQDDYNNICCLKHWNITYRNPVITNMFIGNSNSFLKGAISIEDFSNNNNFYTEEAIADIKKNWIYDYSALVKKGYPIILKDLDEISLSRVHIKLPYHYEPINGNPNNLPNFLDTLMPPDNWKSLIGYYKNGFFTQVRNLI